MVSLAKFYKTSVPIEGQGVSVRIARLTFEQAEAHRRALVTIDQRTRRQRRELANAEALAPEELARLQALHAAEDVETEAAVRAAIEAYVTVEPNQITVEGREVTTGADFMDCFGSDVNLVMHLVRAIDLGARLSRATGKASGSPSGSTRSSGAFDASGPEADGPNPEGTVASAGPADMTKNAAAPAETDALSSGPTATSR
jgi:hypothetical protein